MAIEIDPNDPNVPVTTTVGGSTSDVIIPAPDDTTEHSWFDELITKGKTMLLDWEQTEIAYSTMQYTRAQFGVPLIGNGWTQDQDDQFFLVHNVVQMIERYLTQSENGDRNVAYDAVRDAIGMLGDASDMKIRYQDGVLSIVTGDKTAKVDSSGFTGNPLGPGVIALLIVFAVVEIVGIIAISQVVRDYIKRVMQQDAFDNTQKQIDAGEDPTVASNNTASVIEAMRKKAIADAESEKETGVNKFFDAVTKIAYVALGVGVLVGAFYLFEPMIMGAIQKRRLAQANPVRRDDRVLAEMQDLLRRWGYDPNDAETLQAEGMGPLELEDRLRMDHAGVGDLHTTHGLVKIGHRNPVSRRKLPGVIGSGIDFNLN